MTAKPLDALLQRLETEDAVLVSVERASGSVPREAGAWMAVFVQAILGSVGGGRLEHQAIAQARSRLKVGADRQAAPDAPAQEQALLRYPLGPSLGQCCGGVVFLRFEPIGRGDRELLARRLRGAPLPIALFGGGHVGHALVQLLGTLPCDVAWIDSRDGIFPAQVPPNVACEHSDPVQGAVDKLVALSHVLIMSFSHAEDLDIVAACLRRQRGRADLASIGLIGSKTKWATFRHRLQERGFSAPELDFVTSPIGVPGVQGKEPEVIALAVAAQLLQRRGSLAAPHPSPLPKVAREQGL